MGLVSTYVLGVTDEDHELNSGLGRDTIRKFSTWTKQLDGATMMAEYYRRNTKKPAAGGGRLYYHRLLLRQGQHHPSVPMALRFPEPQERFLFPQR